MSEFEGRFVPAVHSLTELKPDPDFEIGLSQHLRTQYTREELVSLYSRFALGDGDFDRLMRRAIWRAIALRFGHGVRIESGVHFKHLETFEIGDGVFIGAQTFIQGRFDGRCIIEDHVWIGPQSYLDARDLVIQEYVGLGPGTKVLGSTHSGVPTNVPIIQTDLFIRQVKIEAWADIGVNATVLPGVTVGRGSIVGANSVVVRDVAPFAIVAGVPAQFLRWREDPAKEKQEDGY